jgi:hypothetical protein
MYSSYKLRHTYNQQLKECIQFPKQLHNLCSRSECGVLAEIKNPSSRFSKTWMCRARWSELRFGKSTYTFRKNLLFPSSESTSKLMKELAYCCFLFGILFGAEGGGDKLPRNVDGLLPKCMLLQPRILCFSVRELLRVKTEISDYRYYVTLNNNNLSVGVWIS